MAKAKKAAKKTAKRVTLETGDIEMRVALPKRIADEIRTEARKTGVPARMLKDAVIAKAFATIEAGGVWDAFVAAVETKREKQAAAPKVD